MIRVNKTVFVILGDVGKELTGKHASELVASYFEELTIVCRYRKLYCIRYHSNHNYHKDTPTRSSTSYSTLGRRCYSSNVRCYFEVRNPVLPEALKIMKVCALLSGGGYAKKVVVTIGQILPIPQV
ncbi:hypothetical protein DY000_02024610 [Brassica cretica]|uniref:Uncharacterized protein n=1 Tax=Brassica cretica TaxID=69181 RepID=A0ABQ7ECX5_BRACR|nr:hypothetical protein DY000_02024610 [Brassica cretica]